MTDDVNYSESGRARSPYLAVGSEIGAYRIEAFIDRGGMAFVYEAIDLRLNRHVAFKVLAPELAKGSDFRQRFLRESHFAASIDHPNIIPIYEAGEVDGLLYIAMRLVRGNTLDGLISEHGALDLEHALAILSPVADALDTAHAAGLVHRDVKPANILLAAAAARERHEHVYLSDFGVTKQTSGLSKLTATGYFIGTMAYIPPEQIRGEPVDSRSDQYAFGCVAYECLTGVSPFLRDDQAALLWAHLSLEPTAGSMHRSELRPADPVLARVLSKNPQDRFPSCGEFATALADALLDGGSRRFNGPSTQAGTGTVDPPEPVDSALLTVSLRPPIEIRGGAQDGLGKQTVIGGPKEVMSDPEPPAMPPPVPRHRRKSYRRVIAPFVVAALIAVIAVVTTVVLKSRSTEVASAGDDHHGSTTVAVPAAPASGSATATATSPAADSAAAVTVASLSTPSAISPTVPPAPVPAVVPAAAVAIPAIDSTPIPVGATPGYVAITPNGRFAYIANRNAGVVTVVDLTINKVTATIAIPAGPPQYIAFTADGTRAFVSVYNDPKTINLVAVLDTRTTRLLGTIPVDQKPYALAVTPDQQFVYVPSHDAGTVDIISVATNTVVRKVGVLPNPHWVTFTADGKTAYIANHESNVVSVMDTSSNEVVTTIPVGTSPHSVAVSPDGKVVAVVCFQSNDLYFIDSATNTVAGTVALGTNPQDVAFSPDGHYLYTANVESDTVSVVDSETRLITATLPIDSPTSIALAPDGRKAYVTNLEAGTLTVLSTS